MPIDYIHLKNYKSIRNSGRVYLRPLNVLIGANGVGKSNFISFFKFLKRLSEEQLQYYVAKKGGADKFLHFGRKTSSFLIGKLQFDNELKNAYEFKAESNAEGGLFLAEEYSCLITYGNNKKYSLSKNVEESKLPSSTENRDWYLKNFFRTFQVFHFHDTGDNSPLKNVASLDDASFLHEDGSNLAAFLYVMQEKHPKHFRFLTRVLQSIAPFFQSFFLQPDEINERQIRLRWQEKSNDHIFGVGNLSDGTLRMMCLCALLLQPNPPKTIIIDEPELGLHPFAIAKLAGLLRKASLKSQIIISTQSVNLVSEFEPEDILVVDREEGQSVFKRLEKEALGEWLSEFSLGELWQKNLLGGQPKL